MRRRNFIQRDEDIAMPSGMDGWLGYAALVVAVGCVPLTLAALANQLPVWGAVAAVVAIALFTVAFLLLRHSEQHRGPHFFDRGMSVLKRQPRGRMR